jgi:hypothetical protein
MTREEEMNEILRALAKICPERTVCVSLHNWQSPPEAYREARRESFEIYASSEIGHEAIFTRSAESFDACLADFKKEIGFKENHDLLFRRFDL